MAFTVVLDACVLVPHPLYDTLLRLAGAGMFEARWSGQILEEVERTLIDKRGLPAEKARARLVQMERAFPLASVEGHEPLVDAMTNDPKDRHVLAAAVRCGAGTIVTANLKDFPAAALKAHGVEAVHPDEFLLDQLDLNAQTVARCLQEQIASYSNPPATLRTLADGLRHTVPGFATEIGRLAAEADTPLPLVAVDRRAVLQMIGGYDRTGPLSAVAWWWKLLDDPVRERHRLIDAVVEPSRWGDFTSAAAQLEGYNMTTAWGVDHETIAAPVHVVFVPLQVATSSQVVGKIDVNGMKQVTAVPCDDGLWRVDSVGTVRPGFVATQAAWPP
ncbi:PIN domain-containing protein [Isoptericola sp. NPDC055881]